MALSLSTTLCTHCYQELLLTCDADDGEHRGTGSCQRGGRPGVVYGHRRVVAAKEDDDVSRLLGMVVGRRRGGGREIRSSSIDRGQAGVSRDGAAVFHVLHGKIWPNCLIF